MSAGTSRRLKKKPSKINSAALMITPKTILASRATVQTSATFSRLPAPRCWAIKMVAAMLITLKARITILIIWLALPTAATECCE